MEAYRISDLSFTYPNSDKSALDELSLSVKEGELVVIFGYSGCGKSTLLSLLKPSVSPKGLTRGKIEFFEKDINTLSQSEDAAKIGFVGQCPEEAIVTDKVWHELAFGLESLGVENSEIKKRVAEISAYFGINEWFNKNTDELSGGQKQILSLASVMVTNPDVIILDEPTSQLDPVAAREFIETVAGINREFGTTVIISEHRLEEVLSFADKIVLMDKGKIKSYNDIQACAEYITKNTHPLFDALPCSVKVWGSVVSDKPVPENINEGKSFLSNFLKSCNEKLYVPAQNEKTEIRNDIILKAEKLFFRYEKTKPDVLKNASLSLRRGEIISLLGANGSGKSTFLKALCGILKPYSGKIICNNQIAYLSQNVSTMFLKNTVIEEMKLVSFNNRDISKVTDICKLSELLYRHPYDLSGGEKQRLAFAKILLLNPDILLLDEPTKGFDAEYKKVFGDMLNQLTTDGKSVVIVSHDIEFCADISDKIGLFFNGDIVSLGTVTEFFRENRFYTTPAIRMSKGLLENIITTNDIIKAIGGRVYSDTYNQPSVAPGVIPEKKDLSKYTKAHPLRIICSGISAVIGFVLFFFAQKKFDLSALTNENGILDEGIPALLTYSGVLICLIVSALFVKQKNEIINKNKLSKRSKAAITICITAIPVTVLIFAVYLSEINYYIPALLCLIECLIPFFISFEGRKPNTREITVIACLSALAIAGRAAFYMIPQFKPLLAVAIIAGITLGSEAGFIVGAVSMLVSNMLFSQGPWTPWQMLAAGLCALFAGLLKKYGFLSNSKISVSFYGAISAIVIYGGIVNFGSLFMWGNNNLTLSVLLGYYLSGFPFDCIHALATFIFLWVFAKPLTEKLERLKIKYEI